MSLSPPLSTSSNSTSLRSPLGAMSASSASPSLLTPPPTICDPSPTPTPLQTKEHRLTVVVDEGIIDPGWAGYGMRDDKWDSESEPDLGHWDEDGRAPYQISLSAQLAVGGVSTEVSHLPATVSPVIPNFPGPIETPANYTSATLSLPPTFDERVESPSSAIVTSQSKSRDDDTPPATSTTCTSNFRPRKLRSRSHISEKTAPLTQEPVTLARDNTTIVSPSSIPMTVSTGLDKDKSSSPIQAAMFRPAEVVIHTRAPSAHYNLLRPDGSIDTRGSWQGVSQGHWDMRRVRYCHPTTVTPAQQSAEPVHPPAVSAQADEGHRSAYRDGAHQHATPRHDSSHATPRPALRHSYSDITPSPTKRTKSVSFNLPSSTSNYLPPPPMRRAITSPSSSSGSNSWPPTSLPSSSPVGSKLPPGLWTKTSVPTSPHPSPSATPSLRFQYWSPMGRGSSLHCSSPHPSSPLSGQFGVPLQPPCNFSSTPPRMFSPSSLSPITVSSPVTLPPLSTPTANFPPSFTPTPPPTATETASVSPTTPSGGLYIDGQLQSPSRTRRTVRNSTKVGIPHTLGSDRSCVVRSAAHGDTLTKTPSPKANPSQLPNGIPPSGAKKRTLESLFMGPDEVWSSNEEA
ncbi:hypothetical protein EHS25_009857 [Saitozyma podzolica]|uniref:Uncharacterized protein n=1 Tax=Saitozyma podzolica TaxID=1890683 RepID=A0A427YKC8_9TREE|nr:hypothetical protein EHS25_009857 [Saitozyma podzolica]